jgi:hypothetical protein
MIIDNDNMSNEENYKFNIIVTSDRYVTCDNCKKYIDTVDESLGNYTECPCCGNQQNK